MIVDLFTLSAGHTVMTALTFSLMGLIAGKLLYISSTALIEKRTAGCEKSIGIRSQSDFWVYETAAALGFGLISILLSRSIERVEVLFLFSICLCIGWIDWKIRKIPNELLLALVLTKAAFMLLSRRTDFLTSVIGLVVGFALFYLPALLGLPIGAGDIKYAAVAGLYFGLLGFLQVMILMGLALTGFLIYLILTKKGNWKTSAPIGPFISLGFIVTLLFPMF